MGGSATLAKARMELEELYLGIPDESVNLTFQDMAELKKQHSASVAVTVSPSSSSSLSSSSSDKKQLKKTPSSTTPTSLNPIAGPVVNNKDGGGSPSPSTPLDSNSMKKLPSLDFNRGLQAAASNDHSHNLMMHNHTRNHQHDYDRDQSPILHMDHLHRKTQKQPFQIQETSLPYSTEIGVHAHSHPLHVDDAHHHQYHNHENYSNFDDATLPTYHHTDYSVSRHDHHHHHNHSHATMEHSLATYDDISVMSTAFDRGGGGRRRPGIPHTNICTICSTYIYIFRHRCLVCGRVYCRQCVSIGMGKMTEGRKCVDCLGRRFSQRYIQRAGQVGCCSGYPSAVKQAELKWAEKGPRRNAERGHDRSMMMSRSRSPMPMTPTRNNNTNSNPPSFVMSSPSPYSPYSAGRHPIPF